MQSTRRKRVGTALLVSTLLVGAVFITIAPAQETVPFAVYRLKHTDPSKARATLRPLLGELAESTEIIADAGNSTLLIRGSAEAQTLAGQFLREFDKPTVVSPPVVKTIRGYQCPVASQESVSEQLRRQFNDKIRVSPDREGGRLLILADAATHESLRTTFERLSSSGTVATERNRFRPAPGEEAAASNAAARPVTSPPRLTGTPSSPRERVPLFPEISMDNENWEGASAQQRPAVFEKQDPTRAVFEFRIRKPSSIQAALKTLLEKKLEKRGTGLYRIQVETREVLLQFDDRQNSCQLNGHPALVQQVVSLLNNLDRPSEPEGRTIRFIPLRKTDPAVLQQAIRKWGRSARPVDNNEQSSVFEPSAFQVQQTGYVQASSDEQDRPALNAANEEDTDNTPADIRRPVSSVELQSLPDLDVIMIRGRDADVEELTRIIRELERLSEQTKPKIDIYYLKHVRGKSVSEIVDAVKESLTGTLQGRVEITPLIKPDALLLIGWGDAVDTVRGLLEKLDRPVRPETQLQIFRLRHAAVQSVQATIKEFLNERGGLGPDVLVTTDIRTNSLLVNASSRDMQEVKLLIERLDVATGSSVNQGQVIRLKNSLAADLAATLQSAIEAAQSGGTNGRSAAMELLMVDPAGRKIVASGMLGEVKVVADSRTNSLVVSGPADSMKLIESLIQRFDESPAATAQLKVFQLQNADAGEIVLVLRSMFPEQAVPSPVPNLAQSTEEKSIAPIRFSVDNRTNTILATGPAGDLKIIEALLARLDQDGAQQRVNEVYRLKNSPALDVSQAVNQFLQSERIVQQAAPGQQNPFQQIETEVVVVPEVVTNTLIISATPRYFDEIKKLVEKLDEQPPQVLIQVVLAEVELNNFHEFGVELGLQDSLLFDRSLLGDLVTTTNSNSLQTPSGIVTTTQEIIRAASLVPGFSFNGVPLGNSGSDQSVMTSGTVAAQAVSNFSVGTQNDELKYGGLVLSASSENVSVLIRALDEHRHVEILSRPQVMTLDNQPAFIQVGQRVPRITGSSINQVGQVNTIELENVGLILGVTPRISPEGIVVMEVDAEKSELGSEEEGIPVSVSTDGQIIRSPRINVAVAQTTVSAASGQTIVIGGLILNRDRNVSRRVPYISELPIIGDVFRYDSILNRRAELLIILTPHVIRSASEAEHFKQLEMGRMSWCSSDVFQMTSMVDQMPYVPGTLDETGVPVIYPDLTPGLEWKTPPAPAVDEEESDVPGQLRDQTFPDGVPDNRPRELPIDPSGPALNSNSAMTPRPSPDEPLTGIARISAVDESQTAPPSASPFSRPTQKKRNGLSSLFRWGSAK